MAQPLLSICIATYNRAEFIGETLESILCQLSEHVELLVFDGASPDHTERVVNGFLPSFPELRYHRAEKNSGVDRDYDRAVELARGRYCWLMTDDDLLKPDAIERVIRALTETPDLLVVNAEVRSLRFETELQARLLDVRKDLLYGRDESSRCFEELASHLKFIGAVVILRSIWLRRVRQPYFGTLFIHMGVIFQSPPLDRIRVLADPVMVIRYGNAMWSARAFEIWMFKWPRLVWSFEGYSDSSKRRVSAKDPWRSLAKLGVHRALGGYSMKEYRQYFGKQRVGPTKLLSLLVAMLPERLANTLACIACLMMPRKARLNLYDLCRSRNATWISRSIASLLRV